MIVIRVADGNDFESWSKMRTILWPNSTAQEHLSEIQEFIRRDSFRAWMAFDGIKNVGFSEASIRPFANGCDSRPVVFLEGVWIEESYRNQGIGRKLVEAVQLWALNKGIFEIGSDAEISNFQSHICHKKWGFEEMERVIYYRKKLP